MDDTTEQLSVDVTSSVSCGSNVSYPVAYLTRDEALESTTGIFSVAFVEALQQVYLSESIGTQIGETLASTRQVYPVDSNGANIGLTLTTSRQCNSYDSNSVETLTVAGMHVATETSDTAGFSYLQQVDSVTECSPTQESLGSQSTAQTLFENRLDDTLTYTVNYTHDITSTRQVQTEDSAAARITYEYIQLAIRSTSDSAGANVSNSLLRLSVVETKESLGGDCVTTTVGFPLYFTDWYEYRYYTTTLPSYSYKAYLTRLPTNARRP